jgi:hypothetical protein
MKTKMRIIGEANNFILRMRCTEKKIHDDRNKSTKAINMKLKKPHKGV